jgi:hypothetical protein
MDTNSFPQALRGSLCLACLLSLAHSVAAAWPDFILVIAEAAKRFCEHRVQRVSRSLDGNCDGEGGCDAEASHTDSLCVIRYLSSSRIFLIPSANEMARSPTDESPLWKSRVMLSTKADICTLFHWKEYGSSNWHLGHS